MFTSWWNKPTCALTSAPIVDGHQVEHPKPAPDIYLRVAEQLGAAPANCIIFEDSDSGIAAARAAGARVVGVCRYGRRLEGTDITIRDFNDPQLAAWLRTQNPVN